MVTRDGMEVVAPKCLIVPTMENVEAAGMISGMLFLSGGTLMVVSGAELSKVSVYEA